MIDLDQETRNYNIKEKTRDVQSQSSSQPVPYQFNDHLFFMILRQCEPKGVVQTLYKVTLELRLDSTQINLNIHEKASL